MVIDIERLSVAIHGVSAPVVEEAMAGLEAELRRRLGNLRGSFQVHAVPELRVGPLDLPHRVEPAALRHLVAERLLEALLRTQASPVPEEGD